MTVKSRPQAVQKTYKLYVGGAFIRSESGRVLRTKTPAGSSQDQYSWASRKDLRDAVVAARSAMNGWIKRTPYLRGQILYRAAEMLQRRASELGAEIVRSAGVTNRRAQNEVAVSIERLVHYSGWTDKFHAVFSSVNPVATPHFNFTVPEPAGVVAIIAPDEPCLLALISLILPVILSGNTTVVLASEKFPLPALTFAEVLATSDLPGGVVNVMAGIRRELAPHFASHLDINAIVDGTGDIVVNSALRSGQPLNLKRYSQRNLSASDWFTDKAEDPYWILDTVELKTAWHPIGV